MLPDSAKPSVMATDITMCPVQRPTVLASVVWDSVDVTYVNSFFFFFQAEDGIRDYKVTGVQTCALPISRAQHAFVEELSETIIPADSHSGGAKAANVADYIDHVLQQTWDENQKTLWREDRKSVV